MNVPPIRIERPSATPGRVFSIEWQCPYCHGKVDKLDAFCRSCGRQMVEG